MNAFLLWARGERKRVSSDGYGVSQTSLSKFLGETWRHMSVDEKQPFLDMAEALKRQYYNDHPDYRLKLKQRSTTANKTIARKHHSPTAQRQLSTMNSSSYYSSFSPLFANEQQQQQQQQSSSSSMSTVTPHSIQPTVLHMCQAMIPTSSSSDTNNEWFLKLISQPQSVIVAPHPRTQTSSTASRRAVRIQIINKHDDITLPPPTLLSMTPSPLSSSSVTMDETTSTLVDYLTNNCPMFNIPHNQHEQISTMDTMTGYETLQDSANNHLMDLNHHDDVNGWIDTPLSNFGTNVADINSTISLSSSYLCYDFLCL
ncbi:unnamed protein product [Adineta steineri]|uniref:Sex-determining region Y protein n=1 Tax=Adineta steineri TaxID=433720 RepID=A0A814XRQ9_9BILA|nr:unnamed protein product [Adineta steineri]